MLLNDKLKNKQIILASQSPRRKQLLAEMGLQFEIVISDVDESFDQELLQHDVAMMLAEKKAKAISSYLKSNTIIISADTIVCLENHIINKPADRADAIQILAQLSGNRHTVITGVCLLSSEKKILFYVATDVYFKELSTEEIEFYIDNYKPYDKAGAYGIQEWIGLIGLTRMNGSYHNVMGLPTSELYNQLLNF